MIRSLRRRWGWSLEELARRAGLTRQMISYVESLRRVPTLNTLLRIAAALGRELHALLRLAERALPRGSRNGGWMAQP